MADSLKQFYANSNISYSDLTGTGLTIASTNGSQKAVIKDIDFDNPLALKFINYLAPCGAIFGKGDKKITHLLY